MAVVSSTYSGQRLGVVGHARGVQVDDAVDRRVGPVLALHVLRDRAEVVAEVLAAGRLDAAEDAHVYMGWRTTGRLAAAASSRRRTGVV